MLERDLRARGIDTVLIAGTLTNVRCKTTARDASQVDDRVLILADGCAMRTDDGHDAILGKFGDVATIDEMWKSVPDLALVRSGVGGVRPIETVGWRGYAANPGFCFSRACPPDMPDKTLQAADPAFMCTSPANPSPPGVRHARGDGVCLSVEPRWFPGTGS